MSTFVPYLNFDGTCADAMRFYQKVLGGTLKLLPFSESPMAAQAGDAAKDRIMHARLDADGRVIMASDTMPGMKFQGMHGFAVALSYDDVEKAKKVFEALAEGGKVTMPLQKTFFVELFGMVTDKFGMHWIMNGGAESARM